MCLNYELAGKLAGCGGGCKECVEKRDAALRAPDIDPRFAAAHYGHDLHPANVISLPADVQARTLPTLRVKRLRPEAQLPKYATDGAACFDLHVCAPGGIPLTMGGGYGMVTASTFDTGLAFEIPPGWVMLIFSRSGHGFKNDVRLANCVGVIDSDYRGEVSVRLSADTTNTLTIGHGARIAQAMLVPVQQWALVEADELSDTTRGAGGFGSTGA